MILVIIEAPTASRAVVNFAELLRTCLQDSTVFS